MINERNNILVQDSDSHIVLYQPDETISIEVKLDEGYDTVWLSIDQMAQLFGRDKSVIGKHVRAIFKEGELQKDSVWAKFAYTASDGKTYQVDYYNLDVIISVGYRVKSVQGTQFRIWATGVLRKYLMQGYSISRHLIDLQENMDKRMSKIEDIQAKQQEQLDFFIRSSTPPAEMVFFEGDFYTARAALENLVKSAKHRVIIIDGYVSALTLDILDVRSKGVKAVIYTSGVGTGMQRLMQEHDRMFPNPEAHIDIRKWNKQSHDRWLIIDDRLYHCGHSLNANGGHKMSAITLMGTLPEVILGEVREG